MQTAWDVSGSYPLALSALVEEQQEKLQKSAPDQGNRRTPTPHTIQLQLPSTSAERPESHGFVFWLQVDVKVTTSGIELQLSLSHAAVPGCEAYHLLADYELSLHDANPICSRLVDFELLQSDAPSEPDVPMYLCHSLRPGQVPVQVRCAFAVRVRKLLCPDTTSILKETTVRDFALLIAGREIFVNTTFLAEMGGDEFERWAQEKAKGQTRMVLWDWYVEQLQTYLQWLFMYRTPVVTCRNYEFMLEMSSRLGGVRRALRECERFLCDTRAVHDIRKLELAIEHGLAMLGDQVLRGLLQHPQQALNALHEYAQLQDNAVEDLHPDVLEALNVFDDYVVV